MENNYQIFASAGFKVQCGCRLYVNSTFINMAKQQGFDNILAAYVCAENEDNPDIGVVTNINVYDLSEDYRGIPSNQHSALERNALEQYAISLKQANISVTNVRYLGVPALEYTFNQMGLPTKAVYFLKNKKSYLIQVASRQNLTTKYNLVKNSFETLWQETHSNWMNQQLSLSLDSTEQETKTSQNVNIW